MNVLYVLDDREKDCRPLPKSYIQVVWKLESKREERCVGKLAPNLHSEMFENWLPVSQM